MKKLKKKFASNYIYGESNSLYLPRFYGQDKLGLPNKNKINEGIPITIKFNGQLQEKNKNQLLNYIDLTIKNGGGLIR